MRSLTGVPENCEGTDSAPAHHGCMDDVSYAIETHGLVKRFGKTTALAEVDLTARTGSVARGFGDRTARARPPRSASSPR